MFRLFQNTTLEPLHHLRVRKILDLGKIRIKDIQQRAERNPVRHITNEFILVKLVKGLNSPLWYDDEDEYLNIVSSRYEDVASSLGLMTDVKMNIPIDAKLTAPQTFDLVLVEDVYEYDTEGKSLRCLYHPFTATDLRMPDGTWADISDPLYSIWKINVYALMSSWLKFRKAAIIRDQIPNIRIFVNKILAETIASIADIGILNLRARKYTFSDYDSKVPSQYPFITSNQLSTLSAKPYFNDTYHEILNTLPSVSTNGMMETLTIPEFPIRKHIILFYLLARLPIYELLLTYNHGKPLNGQDGHFRYLQDRFERWSFTSKYGMIPSKLMKDVIRDVNNLIKD